MVKGSLKKRVVLDPQGIALNELDLAKANILANHAEDVIWIATPATFDKIDLKPKRKELDQRKVICLAVAAIDDENFEPDELLAKLWDAGVHSRLLEGGSGLYSSFLNNNQVQKLHLFQAAKLFGGQGLINLTRGSNENQQLDNITITPLGDDWLIEGRLLSPQS